MNVLTYQITLREPVLATQLNGDPNSAVSYPYLPGSVLRGMVIGLHIAKHGAIDAADPAIQSRFFNGKTRYLNAYPYLDQPTHPTPASWRHPKNDPEQVSDHALVEVDKKTQWKSVGAPFWLRQTVTKTVTPDTKIAIHTARNRRMGRATDASHTVGNEQAGAVYRYESLAEGQRFRAQILFEEGADFAAVKALLVNGSRWQLGGSSSAGYGTVEISDVTASTGWTPRTQSRSDDKLIVTLQSDLIMRDEVGRYVVGRAAVVSGLQQLAQRLNLAQPIEATDQQFVKKTIVGGFNRKWGLPLPQVPATEMGSVFVLEARDWKARDLQTLLAHGLGERQAEGFGRFAFNQNGLDHFGIEQHKPTALRNIETFKANSLAVKTAERFWKQLLRQQLERQLTEKIAVTEVDFASARRLSNSQIGRLRSIIQTALWSDRPNRQLVTNYLAQLNDRQVTRRQFERVKLSNGQSLLAWLKANNVTWDFTVPKLSINKSNFSDQLKEKMRYEFDLRLMDGVLARLVKEKQQKEAYQ